MKVGIYRIYNNVTNKSYIGSSFNIEKRFKTRLSRLKNHSHHNVGLMADYEAYGESALEFEILKEYETPITRDDLYAEEDLFIAEYNAKTDGYNIGDAKFGDTLTHHPDKLGRVQRMRKTLNETISNMSQKERNLTYGKPKERNGRWRDDLHHNCAKCGKELKSHGGKHGSGYCTSCRDRTGKNNPFYGKKHSAKTIEHFRAINSGRKGKDSPVAKRVYADGLIFDTMTECAEHFGKCLGTITHRVKSPNYPNFYYL